MFKNIGRKMLLAASLGTAFACASGTDDSNLKGVSVTDGEVVHLFKAFLTPGAAVGTTQFQAAFTGSGQSSEPWGKYSKTTQNDDVGPYCIYRISVAKSEYESLKATITQNAGSGWVEHFIFAAAKDADSSVVPVSKKLSRGKIEKAFKANTKLFNHIFADETYDATNEAGLDEILANLSSVQGAECDKFSKIQKVLLSLDKQLKGTRSAGLNLVGTMSTGKTLQDLAGRTGGILSFGNRTALFKMPDSIANTASKYGQFLQNMEFQRFETQKDQTDAGEASRQAGEQAEQESNQFMSQWEKGVEAYEQQQAEQEQEDFTRYHFPTDSSTTFSGWDQSYTQNALNASDLSGATFSGEGVQLDL